MNKKIKIFLLILGALTLLTACGKKEETLEAYVLTEGSEDVVVALDSILGEGEAILSSVDAPTDIAIEEGLDVSHTYHYRQMEDPAELAGRYAKVLMGGEQGFKALDEENHLLTEEPVADTLIGEIILGKAATAESEDGGSRFVRVVVGWSEYSVAVQVAYMSGRMLPPVDDEKVKEEEETKPSAVSEQLDYFNSLNPSQLGLDGDDMSDYMVYPQQAWVLVDGISCRELRVYLQDAKNATNVIVGTFYLSSDMSHVYKKNADGQIVPVSVD